MIFEKLLSLVCNDFYKGHKIFKRIRKFEIKHNQELTANSQNFSQSE